MSQVKIHPDKLVHEAERLVEQIAKQRANEELDIGKTQASKAIEVAQSADSLRLFINWLRYQAARETDRQQFWSMNLSGGKTLAQTLTEVLKRISPKEPEKAMPAVRLFLGYFRRALVGIKFLDRIKVED